MVSMFSRILVPVDGLAASEQAVLTAIALAVAFNASVATASVIDFCASTGVASNRAYGQDECVAAVDAQADTAIQAAAQPCAAKVVTAVSSKAKDQRFTPASSKRQKLQARTLLSPAVMAAKALRNAFLEVSRRKCCRPANCRCWSSGQHRLERRVVVTLTV